MNPEKRKDQIQIKRLLAGIALLGVFALASCIPQQPSLPTLTPTSIPATQTPTVTVVWFPPTATFTPYPSPTALPPTPEMRPGIGALILKEDFRDAGAWQLVDLDGGSALLGKNELTIAISKERVYVSSLRTEPLLTNFYTEITVNPNLCRGQDEYGLLIRSASPQDFYRFGITCKGQVRLDRIYRGGASSPQPQQLSGSVPIGAPSFSRLGVWAVGAEMRFFINEDFQFSVQDGTIPAGFMGVFARSASDESLTVNFFDLSIWEVIPVP